MAPPFGKDLRTIIRDGRSDDELKDTLIFALHLKPEKHNFDIA
jgi:hypothetical protein